MNVPLRALLSATLGLALANACSEASTGPARDDAADGVAAAHAAADTAAVDASATQAAPGASAARPSDAPSGPPRDAPLPAASARLLELAFDAASEFPLDPHVKNRSRDQAQVVDACLRLDQPERALRLLPRIENWRRGQAHADTAFWLAEHGFVDGVSEQLAAAREVATWPEERIGQGWRRDRIRARMAATELLLGNPDEAAALVVGLDASAVGVLQTTRARLADDEAFETTLDGLERALLAQPFDVVRAALDACALLYDRHYEDPARRARIEQRIVGNRTRMPRDVAYDVGLRMAETALAHDDPVHGLRLVDDARAILDGGAWTPEVHVPMLARQAALRHAAGQRQQGLDEADAARKLFEAERARIFDVFRVGALVPLAEAYVDMGRRDAAEEVYLLAAREAVVNPNSRPRVDDLTALCVSMALRGFAPGEELWQQLRSIRDGLGDPW